MAADYTRIGHQSMGGRGWDYLHDLHESSSLFVLNVDAGP
jgi:hypothetical protein